jgi:hypothetical protein
MRRTPWLRATALLLASFAVALPGCSTSDDSSGAITPIDDASQPAVTKFEAGSPCSTSNDCVAGLVCLHPATNCHAFAVCVSPPPTPCDNPQLACSCLVETIAICDGYGSDAIDSLGPCADTGAVSPLDASADGPGAADAAEGIDASEAGTFDASDASGE